MPTIIHHMSRAQLDNLARVVGKPFDHFGEIDWVLPAWWHLAYVFATR